MDLSNELDRLLFYAALHVIGDFVFQSSWMNAEKGKRWEVLAYHCLAYVSPFILAAYLVEPVTRTATYSGLAWLFVSHMVVDAAKSRWGIVREIWIDQLLHALAIILAVAINRL